MKNIIKFIKESLIKESVNEINQFYVKIDSFKNGEKLILCFIRDNGYAEPMEVVVKKNGKDVIFVNPDDDRDMHEWKEFINTTDDSFREEINPQVAVAKDMKEAKDICKFFNTFVDM